MNLKMKKALNIYIVLFFICIMSTAAFAASHTMAVLTDKAVYEVGETVHASVIVTLSENQPLNYINSVISFDYNALTTTSNNVISVPVGGLTTTMPLHIAAQHLIGEGIASMTTTSITMGEYTTLKVSFDATIPGVYDLVLPEDNSDPASTEHASLAVLDSLYNPQIVPSTKTPKTIRILDAFPVSFDVTGGNGGLTATVEGTGIVSGDSVTEGKTVILTAAPNSGYRVKEWKDNNVVVNGTNATYTIANISATHIVTVEFDQVPTYAVTVSSTGTGASGSGNYTAGATVNISAGTAPSGQSFVNWTTTSPGVTFASATSSSTSFTMPTNAVTVTANFELITYAVTVSSTGTGSSGGGNYAPNATVNINAGTAPSGQYFVNWTTTSPGVTFASATSSSTSFSMPANAVTVTANFSQMTYGITLNPSANKDFGTAVMGYSAQTPHSVTISNSGNQATGNLTVALSGTNASSFSLSGTSISSIAVGGNSSFTVAPTTGLGAGTYSATVTVSGANITSRTFNVSFVVTANYAISLDPAGAKDFGSVIADYTAVTPHSVTIKNDGDQPTGALTIALSGTNSSSFALSVTTVPSIAVNGNYIFTVTPNTGLAGGTYSATVSVSGANITTARTFNVSFTVTAKTFGITLDPTGNKTFDPAAVNYGEQTPYSVTVKNEGNQPTSALTIALSGTGSSSFKLSKTSITNIASGGSDSFTVAPNTGLAAGTYTATVTVSGGSNTPGSFNVSFTVNAATYGIALDPPDTTKVFDPVSFGYGAQQPYVVTVNNTGNQPTGELTVSLTGTGASSFSLNKTSISSIAAGGSDSFSVVPNTGLAIDPYAAIVTVSSSNPGIASRQITLAFVVLPVLVTFKTQPAASTTVVEGYISSSLTVEAILSSGGAPSYEWFSNTTASNSGGTTTTYLSATLPIPTNLTEGTYYYYCVAGAADATSVASNVATVIVVKGTEAVEPTYPSQKNVVSDVTGIATDDLDKKDDNKVYLKKSLAEKIAKALLGLDSVKVKVLPVFQASLPNLGQLASVSLTMNGKDLLSLFPDFPSEDLNLIGMISGKTGKLFEYVYDELDFDDMTFTILYKGQIFEEEFKPGEKYELVVFIKDGGEFDLDGIVNKSVTASIFFASEKTDEDDENWYGCNAGFGMAGMLILLSALFVTRKRQR